MCVLQSTGAFAPRQQPHKPSFITARHSTATPESTTTTEEERRATKKDERLRMMKSDQFHRKGFKEVREDVESTMQQQFQSNIVKDLRESNYLMEKDGVKVYLAKVRRYTVALGTDVLDLLARLEWDPTQLIGLSFSPPFHTGFRLLLGRRTKYRAGL